MTAASVHAPWPRAASEPASVVWRFARVVPSASHGVQIEWLLKRNCSMSPAQLFAVYLSMCAVSLAIALGFTWQGASPVLAFAGIELMLVGVALLVYARHALDGETVRLQGGRLSVERECAGRRETLEFGGAPRVRIRTLAHEQDLIELQAPGRRLSVGRHVRPQWRCALAGEMRRALQAGDLHGQGI